jgi:hypothetical protein
MSSIKFPRILQTQSIYYDSSNTDKVQRATLLASISSGSNFAYWLSADGGINFEEVSNGVEHTFSTQGYNLKIRIVGIGEVTFLKCVYVI